MPLELLQQLHWWLVVPFGRTQHRNRLILELPLALRLKACWLNSYQPQELAWWWAAGVRSWHAVSCNISQRMVCKLHHERRQSWPRQCLPATELLGDKAALLGLTPPSWRPAFLKLELHTPTETTPNWWWDALHRDGVVLKPLRGHACRDVVRFRWHEQRLCQMGLFRQLTYTSSDWTFSDPPDPAILFRHWQKTTGSPESAIAGPYLQQSRLLPESIPSTVVRVITAQAAPNETIGVIHAWLEVPLNGGVVIYLDTDGLALPKPGKPLTIQQSQELQEWQELLNSGDIEKIQGCLNASITMHTLLPPIDQAAWDWVPTDQGPLLLEGNGNFGLLVPQLFQRMRESMSTTKP